MPGARPDDDHAPASTNQPNTRTRMTFTAFPGWGISNDESVTTNRTTP